MQTSNPAFSDNILSHFDQSRSWGTSTTLTAQGTALKGLVLLALVMLTAAWSWDQTAAGTMPQGLMVGSMIGGFVLALITTFKPTAAPWTAPIYAAVQGVFLGSLSRVIENQGYPGIAFQAVALTGGVSFVMLFTYVTGLIKVTGQLVAAVTAATGAIALVYLASWIAGMFGYPFTLIQGSGGFSIAFSVFVVGLAAFNLLLDFDQIDRWSRSGAPKSMEWYCAFGLMVTLIWLYLEIVRLLMKLQSRRD
ncbi:Bax inhibitor-1/YccA family protein [Tundrisphaera sp. TA3]|uniref:Bax inhibitor-1/YccA family protein n=1 Tax=Tundrisphaera sp. TA3 TaxID=3435775 RepID=UPI003EC132F5